MAPDSGDSPTKPKFSREYHEYTFESAETGVPLTPVETDTSDVVNVGLTTMMYCVGVLMKARTDGRIEFAPGVTATILETMGVLLMRAAHTSDAGREAMFHHWQEAGPPMIDELIEEVSAREGRLLMPDDLASMFMGKPPGY